jgi:hypothetical protein
MDRIVQQAVDAGVSNDGLRDTIMDLQKELLQRELGDRLGKSINSAPMPMQSGLPRRPGLGPEQSAGPRGYAPMGNQELLDWMFTYHDDPGKSPNYIAIRTAAKHFAETVLNNVEPCADRSEALRMLRLVVMWANAALALDGVTF